MAPEAIINLKVVCVGCCHGDWQEYPLAQIKIEVGDQVQSLRTGVVPILPREVMLETDTVDLAGLAATGSSGWG